MTIPINPVVVTAFVLALVRASAWLFVAPPFNTRMIPNTVKAGVAASLALAAAHHITNPVLPTDTGAFITSLLVQALVGFTLGMFTLLLVNALQAAGQFVDLFAGFSLSAIYDPFNNAQAAVFGRFYELLATTLLFTTDAYLILVNGFFRSFDVIPAGGLVDQHGVVAADPQHGRVPHRGDRDRGPDPRVPVPRRDHPRPPRPRRAEPQRVRTRVPVCA